LSHDKAISRLAISFREDGDIVVKISQHESRGGPTIILELFAHYFVKTLFDIGRSASGELLISSFEQIVQKFVHGETYFFNLTKVANLINAELRLGLNLERDLGITEFRLVSNKRTKSLAKQQAVLMARKSGSKYIKTQPDKNQREVFLPLSVLALFNSINQTCLSSDPEAKLKFTAYLQGILSTGAIHQYHDKAGLQVLGKFTNAFFRN
jgi:hypothetical protein